MPRGPAGPMKRWLAIARDDQAGGSHLFVIEATSVKEAYQKCATLCVMNELPPPEQRAVYELPEDFNGGSGTLICTVLDAKPKEGLFNGRSNVSVSGGATNARSWAGAILR